MLKRMMVVASIFIAGMSSGLAMAHYSKLSGSAQSIIKLDNERVNVTEITMSPGAHREPYTRPADQVIVFLDPADYESTDADGKKLIKHRERGEIIWHHKGEAAPLLINKGKRAYRNLVVALK